MIDVTIAIPIYNVESYVEASLRSALDQELAEGSLEVLIVDDCGRDRSMELVRHVAEQHPCGGRVRIVSHPHNLGLGEARNTAIDHARGRYLLFLDSDDVLLPGSLSHLYTLAQAHEADVVAGSTEEISPSVESATTSVVKMRYHLADDVVRHEAAGVWMHVHGREMNIEVWNKLFRLDFLRRHHIRTVHRVMEDSVFDFRVRLHAQCIVTSSRTTLRYTLRKDSILGSMQNREVNDAIVDTYLDIICQCQQIVGQQPVPGIYDLYCLRLFYSYYSLKKIRLTHSQLQRVESTTRDFVRFIPCWRQLATGIARLAVIACSLRGYRWQTFEYIYDHRYQRRYYWMAKWLQGCCIHPDNDYLTERPNRS